MVKRGWLYWYIFIGTFDTLHSYSVLQPLFFLVLTINFDVTALEDSEDILVHLKPLSKILQSMEELDFNEIGPYLPAIMHVLAMTYANCKAYSAAPRIMVILTEISNQIVDHVSGVAGHY